MRRIVLTIYEDVLLVDDKSYTFREHGIAGLHEECGGYLSLVPISKKWMVLRCKECGLRVPLLRTIRSYEELESYLTDKRLRG